MKMYVAGTWTEGTGSTRDVINPFTGEAFETAPDASIEDATSALESAQVGARQMAGLPAYRRAELLEATADIIESRVTELGDLISREEGKPHRESHGEAGRIPAMLRYCAGEALRRGGEVIPMDAAAGGLGRLGFTLPEPCGVVLAITPFNFPALLVLHKIGPALAAGNAVILKPAEATPLTALFLTECIVAAGFPENAMQCITGDGAELGAVLCASPVVRKISFTGSVTVGHQIARTAGAKRLTCELGSSAAVVVLPDADLDLAAREIVRSGYSNAGQVCISAQRVVVDPSCRDELVERVDAGVAALVMGDPTSESTTLGPVISHSEAKRITATVDEAVKKGAQLLRGGESSGASVDPVVLLDPHLDASVWTEEVFGPVVAVRAAPSFGDAVRLADDSQYGLSMSVFTQDIDRALKFASVITSGMVHINSGPLFRIDSMPYGGVRESGFGKEGIRYAMDEMTEHKLVVVHPGRNA